MLLFRLGLAGIFVLALCAVLITQLYRLQIRQHGYYTAQSKDNRMQAQVVAPVRGLIYDRNGRLLAENLPSYSLVATPAQVPDLRDSLKRLSRLLNLKPSDIHRFRSRKAREPAFRSVLLLPDLSQIELARFEVNRQDFPGFDIQAGLTRHYPLGPVMAQVVGYVGRIDRQELSRVKAKAYRGTDYFGKTGVEHFYQALLHGGPGSRIEEVNAQGRDLRQIAYNAPHSGENLYLTLSTKLQKTAFDALGGESGAVVALAPRTGAILAMVSKPGFNPDWFVNGISEKKYQALLHNSRQPLFNRAIKGRYPPGSTVKPAIALTGLHTDGGKYIHPRYDPGWYQLANSTIVFHSWKQGGFGRVNLEKAIEVSDDIYFYDLAHDLGIDRIHGFLSKLGLGRPTGVDLSHEGSGVLPSRKWKRQTIGHGWYPGDTVNAGIGQGYMSVTPLQLALMVSRIAMRGKGARPHILYATQDPVTGKITRAPIHPLKPIKFENPHAWQRVVDGMKAAINNPHGTAHGISHGITYTAAGKTGTSEVGPPRPAKYAHTRQSQLPRRYRDDTLFIAFAPVEHPRIAVAVIVEHGGFGAAAAAPIARQVMDAYLGPGGVVKPLEKTADKPLTVAGRSVN